jgi:hypothetical protein
VVWVTPDGVRARCISRAGPRLTAATAASKVPAVPRGWSLALALTLGPSLLGCEAREAPRVELPVVVDGSGLEPLTTDLGWTVALSEARVAIGDVVFTTAGELHGERRPSPAARLLGVVIRRAHAHPGHYQGGEIIGELPGAFILDFLAGDGEELGLATLIVGDYTAANFGLRRAGAAELEHGDPLVGHTAILRGTATAPGEPAQVVEFSITLDSPLDREIVGVPFEFAAREDPQAILALRLLSADPFEGKQLFDGVDFAALDEADGQADGLLELVDPGTTPELDAALAAAYHRIRRAFQSHDFFEVLAREP